MFENISTKKIKKILFFKFLFQTVGFTIIVALLFLGLIFFLDWVRYGLDHAISGLTAWQLWCIVAMAINLPNILSFITLIKLTIDCITPNAELSTEIEIVNILPCYELPSLRQSKRFMCDTFSRKKNAEILLYDTNKNKYRLFWNDGYGTYESYQETIKADKVRIKYLKYSKIILMCEIV